MTDCNLLGADKNVLDEQPQNTLTIDDLHAFRALAQLRKESLKIGREGKVKVTVGDLAVKRLEPAAEVRLTRSQLRHSRAELVDGDQLLLERLDHTGDRGGGLRERIFDLFTLARGRIRVPSLVQPTVDLLLNERRIAEQLGDVFPHDVVDVVGADRLVLTDPAILVTVVVGSEAAVVVDLLA